jgi:hypothetical protein
MIVEKGADPSAGPVLLYLSRNAKNVWFAYDFLWMFLQGINVPAMLCVP